MNIANGAIAFKPETFFLAHALDYARRGWSIIPVIDKKPVGLWKPFQQQPADEATLQRLFARNGITGLAVITGQVSGGLAARDFDVASAYHTWAAACPEDATRLPTVQTARGYHVYGQASEETFADLGDGELRADSGHYLLLPPSRHPEGPAYSWLVPLPSAGSPLPALPSSLTGRDWQGEREKIQATQATQATQKLIACVPTAARAAIQATLPDGPGQRNRKVFDLARRLRGIVGLDTSPATLKAIVTEWHRQALPFIRTKDFGETWSDFQIAWQRVKCPHGARLREAHAAAQHTPQAIDGNRDLGALAALCRNLSAASADRRFFLSCRTVADLFGISRMAAWRSLSALQFFGIIELVEKGTLRDHQASIWRYMPPSE